MLATKVADPLEFDLHHWRLSSCTGMSLCPLAFSNCVEFFCGGHCQLLLFARPFLLLAAPCSAFQGLHPLLVPATAAVFDSGFQVVGRTLFPYLEAAAGRRAARAMDGEAGSSKERGAWQQQQEGCDDAEDAQTEQTQQLKRGQDLSWPCPI